MIVLFFMIFPNTFGMNIKYINNGILQKKIYLSKDGYISLMSLSKEIGSRLSWEDSIKRIEISRNEKKVTMLIGRPLIMYAGGRLRNLSKPPRIINGEVFIPADSLRVIYNELSIRGESWALIRKKQKDYSNIADNIFKINKRKNHRNIDVIFIDAGHGGRDPGCVANGLKESEVVLKIAKYVKYYLKDLSKTVRIILTRKNNTFVSLSNRAKIANHYIKKGYKCLFISIHANASISKRRYGFETYYLSPMPSNADARSTAVLENGALELDTEKKKKGNMHSILSKMLVEEYRRESVIIAGFIQKGLASKIGSHSKNRHVKKANFFVMRMVYMPSVLVEVGFLTNRREAGLLRRSYYRKKLASGIASGIKKFIQKFNKNI